MQTPKIFAVMVFKMVNGMRQLDTHHVAAFDPKGAALTLVKFYTDHLHDVDAFVQSEDNCDRHHSPALRMYTTRYSNEDRISDDEYASWVKRMTRAQMEDGEIIPAAFVDLFKLV